MIQIRCSRCGKTVPYDFKNFINIKDEPVCNECYYGKTQTMTDYLNKLTPSKQPEDNFYSGHARREIENILTQKEKDYLELMKKFDNLREENKQLEEALTKGCYQNLQHECRIWELKESKYRSALEEIKELNKHCADCEGNTCGVCAAADGKPNNSYRIANEALK